MTNNITLTTTQTYQQVKQNWLAFGGGLLVLSVFVIAVFAPLIAPYDPSKIDIKNILVGPSSQHLFGTDDLGRDVL
jgi:ABC-type dipeptide/oligopeptide/nickel transport system permease subunit